MLSEHQWPEPIPGEWKCKGSPENNFWHYEQVVEESDLLDVLPVKDIGRDCQQFTLKVTPGGIRAEKVTWRIEDTSGGAGAETGILDQMYNEAGRRLNVLIESDQMSLEAAIDVVADVANRHADRIKGGSQAGRRHLQELIDLWTKSQEPLEAPA